MFNYNYFASCIKSVKVNKKIVVIESDDWGSERIPNITVRNKLKNIGIDYCQNPHLEFDTLENEEDLQLINSLLTEIENRYDKKVTITANFNIANPDYNKIANSNFEDYFYQVFTDTYTNKYKGFGVMNELIKLIKSNYFKPQYHGREHVNYLLWLNELKSENKHYKQAFDLECYAIDAPCKYPHLKNMMASFEYFSAKHKAEFENSIKEGLSIFSNIFDFSSKTIVPTRHVWHTESEGLFFSNGIKAIQTSLIQYEPTLSNYNKVYHYTGKENRQSKIRYMVRNIFFEPSYNQNYDWVGSALSKLRLLFLFNIPVIISMHRINFVGGLDSKQRDFNLTQFKKLIESIITEYPNVFFISSDELSDKLMN